LAVTAAWLLALLPSLASALLFHRQAMGDGEFWRLWTGHWIHFTPTHLVLDTLVLAWAGSMVERRDRGHWLIFLATAPWIISAGLLVFLPDLEIYGGLSGLATGAVVLWVVELQERSTGWKKAGWVILALIALKIGLECLNGSAMFADLEAVNVRSVPLSHAMGGGLGLLLGWCFRQRLVYAMPLVGNEP
jgi:rhomboid family GlyGly-CTERM serine protease